MPPPPALEEGLLLRLAAEPALVVLVLAGFGAAIVAAVLWRLRRLVRDARARAALEDYLLGIEDALGEDHASARSRLERVLRAEPANHVARMLLAEVLLAQGDAVRAHEEHRVVQEAAGGCRRNDLVGARALLAAGRAAEAARVLGGMRRSGDADALRLQLRAELGAGLTEDALRTADRLATLVPAADAPALETTIAHVEHRLQGRAAAALPAASETSAWRAAALASLAEPFVCGRCQLPSAAGGGICPHCGARGALAPSEPRLSDRLPSPGAAVDEIEETPAHVERLVRRVVAGDGDVVPELVDTGLMAVGEIWRTAMAEPAAEAQLVPVLVAMGGDVVPRLLAEFVSWRGTSPVGQTAPAVALLARVLEGIGRPALRHLQDLVGTDDADLRKVVVDCHVALGTPAEFEVLLERYPPVEVIQRLNAAPRARLVAWLVQVPSGGFVAEVLLADPMFRRDEALLVAAGTAADATPLLDLLDRRGASHEAIACAIGLLGADALAGTAERYLAGVGLPAGSALLSAFLDPETPAAARERAKALLAGLGASIVPAVCACFGGSASHFDSVLLELLAAIGAEAVAPLREAYARRNLLERVGGRLVRRYTHPRNVIVKALAAVGGAAARSALQALRAEERDPNLKLRIDQALHAIERQPLRSGQGHPPSTEQVG